MKRVAPRNAISNFTDRRREMYLLNSYLGALLFLPPVCVPELQMRANPETEKRNNNKQPHTRFAAILQKPSRFTTQSDGCLTSVLHVAILPFQTLVDHVRILCRQMDFKHNSCSCCTVKNYL